MGWGKEFGPDMGFTMLIDPHPRPFRAMRAFGHLFGSQQRAPATPRREPRNNLERLRQLEREAQGKHHRKFGRELLRRGRPMQPDFEPETRRQHRREPSIHPGFGRDSQHPRREPSLHPGFTLDFLRHRKGRPLNPDINIEDQSPRAHRHEITIHRERAHSAIGLERSARRVHFQDQPAENQHRSRFDSSDFGLGRLSLGRGSRRDDQRHHGTQQRRGLVQADIDFPRQPQRAHSQLQPRRRGMNDLPDMSLGGNGPRHHRRHSEVSRRPFLPAPAHLKMPGGPFIPRNAQTSAMPLSHGIMNKYTHVKSLVEGGMSTAVNIVQSRSTGELFVQKCVSIVHPSRMKRFRAEVDTLSTIKRYGGLSNLNYMIEFEAFGGVPEATLILDYCDKGSVEDLMKAFASTGNQFPEAQAWNIILGVGKALAFLHHGIHGNRKERPWDPIAHLDLKPCNIFLSSSGGQYGYPRVVLADFGCAIKKSDVADGREHPLIQECGTSEWYPPENLGQTWIPHYGPMTDIWQLGATIHTFCLVIKMPHRGILESSAPCGRNYSAMLNSCVAHMAHPDSFSRPSPRDVVYTAEQEFRRAARNC